MGEVATEWWMAPSRFSRRSTSPDFIFATSASTGGPMQSDANSLCPNCAAWQPAHA